VIIITNVDYVEATAPVKLPARHCSPRFLVCGVRFEILKGWYSILRLLPARKPRLKASHLFSASKTSKQCQAVVKLHGVFSSWYS